MCGIVGGIAQRDISRVLLEGLYRLEYRGYDSAGIAGINDDTQQLQRLRTLGKVSQLDQALSETPLPCHLGIAHTRWATHGKPCQLNAHPHFSADKIGVVHNGIIENHAELRQQLSEQGYQFESETDTEVIAHLIHSQQQPDILQAVQTAVKQLKGSYALAIIDVEQPERLIAVCCNSPLVIGITDQATFLASDQLALITLAHDFIYLEQGNIADCRPGQVTVYAEDGSRLEPEIHTLDINPNKMELGEYRHYMHKEIHEQPHTLQHLIDQTLNKESLINTLFLPNDQKMLAEIERVQIVACGSSFHAGLVAKTWLESVAKMPCQVEVASEIRYRDTIVEPNTLYLTISQSGETADTLSAVRQAKNQGYAATLTVCNVARSTLVRESDIFMHTLAGTEIGVASTKAFVAQLTSLLLLTVCLAEQRGHNPKRCELIKQQLETLPQTISQVIALEPEIKEMAAQLSDFKQALFVGRRLAFPIALEGALKLKEITYMFAEAHPAGELKHGPLALVDNHLPIVAIVPNTPLLCKIVSNLNEIQARSGKLFVFHEKSLPMDTDGFTATLAIPPILYELTPILYTIPLQLLAYHVAVLRGNDVDQPRNLAKSVTVE